jgi:hypothetical protein
MPFGRISDDLNTNRKVRRLVSLRGGREALGLWTMADSWCNKELTDGHVPDYMVEQLGGWKLEHADLLVSVGLWHRAEDGYQFHDWEDFNDTREEVLTKRAKDAAKKGNQRSSERASKALTRHLSPPESPRDTQRDSDQTHPGCPGAPTPTPDPDPSLTTFENVSPHDGATTGVFRTSDLLAAAGLSEAPASTPKQRKPPSKPKALVALEAALRAEMQSRRDVAPSMSRSLGLKAAQRVTEHAESTGGTLEASAAVLAASWAALGNGNAWKLCDVPFRATQAPGRHQRTVLGTTAEDFEDAPSVEEQMARFKAGGS